MTTCRMTRFIKANNCTKLAFFKFPENVAIIITTMKWRSNFKKVICRFLKKDIHIIMETKVAGSFRAIFN